MRMHKCDLCSENEAVYDYILMDNSSIRICEQCGKIVYGKDIKPYFEDRLFHIIALLEYVKAYKQREKAKTLVKTIR